MPRWKPTLPGELFLEGVRVAARELDKEGWSPRLGLVLQMRTGRLTVDLSHIMTLCTIAWKCLRDPLGMPRTAGGLAPGAGQAREHANTPMEAMNCTEKTAPSGSSTWEMR